MADEARAAGIRSESREEADKGLNPRGVKTQRRAGERSEFGKSASVFARMQEVAEMERAGVKVSCKGCVCVWIDRAKWPKSSINLSVHF